MREVFTKGGRISQQLARLRRHEEPLITEEVEGDEEGPTDGPDGKASDANPQGDLRRFAKLQAEGDRARIARGRSHSEGPSPIGEKPEKQRFEGHEKAVADTSPESQPGASDDGRDQEHDEASHHLRGDLPRPALTE